MRLRHFEWSALGLASGVTTKELTKREVIEVSPPSQSQSTGQAGFIREGFTKHGIYVSHQFIKLFRTSIFTHFWHGCRHDLMAESTVNARIRTTSHVTFRCCWVPEPKCHVTQGICCSCQVRVWINVTGLKKQVFLAFFGMEIASTRFH